LEVVVDLISLLPSVPYFSSSSEEVNEYQKAINRWICPYSSLQGSWFEEKNSFATPKRQNSSFSWNLGYFVT